MADKKCPHYREIFCMINRLGLEYDLCNHDNHFECQRYLRNAEKEKKVDREREEIVNSMPQSD